MGNEDTTSHEFALDNTLKSFGFFSTLLLVNESMFIVSYFIRISSIEESLNFFNSISVAMHFLCVLLISACNRSVLSIHETSVFK